MNSDDIMANKDYIDGEHGTCEAPDVCDDCGEIWSAGQRIHTGDQDALGGWEDWRYCSNCGNEMFYPVKQMNRGVA